MMVNVQNRKVRVSHSDGGCGVQIDRAALKPRVIPSFIFFFCSLNSLDHFSAEAA
jgi:hypothetical protein